MLREKRPGSWEFLAALVRGSSAYRQTLLLLRVSHPAAKDPLQASVPGPDLDWKAEFGLECVTGEVG